MELPGELTSRTDSEARCPYCHDQLEGEALSLIV